MAKKSDKQYISSPSSAGDGELNTAENISAAARTLELRGSPAGRAAKGSWFTPPSVAVDLWAKVRKYLPGDRPLRVIDPSCGGGIFAAAVINDSNCTFTGFDIDPDAVAFCRKHFPMSSNTFILCNTLLEREPDGSFDVVIGNPPFVALPNIPEDTRKKLRQKYILAKGRFNLWALFIEWSIQALVPGGIGALILPDRLWRNTGDENVRQYLEEHANILEYGEYPAGTFADAVVDSGYVIFSAGGKTPAEKRLCRAFTSDDAVLQQIKSNSIPLGEILEIRDGIIPGHHAAEIFRTFPPGSKVPAYCKKLLTGRDVFPQKIVYRNRRVDYRPQLWQHSSDRGIRFRKPEIFEAPKIMTRQTSDSLIAAWDADGSYYYANTLHGGRLKTGSFSGEFLAAYLSGTIANHCYKKLTGETGRPFAQVKITVLRTLPIPLLTVAEQKKCLLDNNEVFNITGIDTDMLR